jgi:hypothetical protein
LGENFKVYKMAQVHGWPLNYVALKKPDEKVAAGS